MASKKNIGIRKSGNRKRMKKGFIIRMEIMKLLQGPGSRREWMRKMHIW